MLHANDDKICFTAPQITFDLRDPIAVSDIDETPAQRWKIAKRFLKHTIKASDAVSALETATRLLPSSSLAWRHLAEAYQATGRSTEGQPAAVRVQQLGSAGLEQARRRCNPLQAVVR